MRSYLSTISHNQAFEHCGKLTPVRERHGYRQRSDNRWHRWLLCSSLANTILSSLPAYAQSPEPTLSSPASPASERPLNLENSSDATLEGIQTTAEIPYQTGDVIDEENTSSHSRVERETLERSANSLAAILAQESGVQHRQFGGFGSFSSISIRAATGAQTGIYLDGVLLNGGGTPVVDLSTLEMLDLSSVDIYRGSTPLQLGNGTIGGAVNLNSLRSSVPATTKLRLGLGSLARREMQLSHQATEGAWEMTAAFSHRQSDNNFSFINNNRTPLNPDDDRREQRHNAAARRSAALLRTSYQYDSDTRTNLTVQLSMRDLGVTEFRNNPNNTASYDTASSQLQLSQILDGLGNWNSRHSLYWLGQKAQYNDIQGHVGLGSQDTDSDTQTVGAKTYWEYLADAGTLGLSLDTRYERYESTDDLNKLADFGAKRQSTQAAIHYVWFDDSEAWSLTPAIQWQYNQMSGSRTAASGETARLGNSSNTGFQLGFAYRPAGAYSLTANTGTYYREPSFGELYGSTGLVDGNAELLPEKGFNMDIALHYQSSRGKLSATIFGSERDELIVTTFDSRGIGEPNNTGAARVFGLELAADLSLTPQIKLQSNLTWQSPRSRNTAVGFYGRLLPGEAQIAWSSRLQYQPSRATFWYELDMLRKRFYDLGNNLPAADSEVHSIGIDWNNSQWQTTLGIQNLGDNNIEDFNGFPKPGRTWSLTLTRTLTSPTS